MKKILILVLSIFGVMFVAGQFGIESYEDVKGKWEDLMETEVEEKKEEEKEEELIFEAREFENYLDILSHSVDNSLMWSDFSSVQWYYTVNDFQFDIYGKDLQVLVIEKEGLLENESFFFVEKYGNLDVVETENEYVIDTEGDLGFEVYLEYEGNEPLYLGTIEVIKQHKYENNEAFKAIYDFEGMSLKVGVEGVLDTYFTAEMVLLTEEGSLFIEKGLLEGFDIIVDENLTIDQVFVDGNLTGYEILILEDQNEGLVTIEGTEGIARFTIIK